MTWKNAKMQEREQDDGIGTLSIDWHDDSDQFVCTYTELIKASNKAKFKTNANAFKDKFIAKQAKKSNVEAQILTYMNGA